MGLLMDASRRGLEQDCKIEHGQQVANPSEIKTRSKYNLLIICFSVMPIIDSINGALIKGDVSGLFSLGMVYRFFLIVTCFFYVLNSLSKKYLAGLLSAAGIGLLSVLAHSAMGLSDSVGSDLNELFLFLMAPYITFTLLSLSCRGSEKAIIVDRMLDNLQIIAPLTILVPFALGIGYSTYSTSGDAFVGYKAFYYATNGITLMLICLFARSVYLFFMRRSISAAFVMALNLLSLFLIGTKSALLMLVVSFFLALYCVYGKHFASLLLRVACVLAIVLVIAYLFSDVINQYLEPLINRWSYFYGTVYSGDLISALTTGRTERISQHLALLLDSPTSALSMMLGMGVTTEIMNICEMDYFDVFFEFGLVGLMLLVMYIVYSERLMTGKNSSLFFRLIILFLLLYALVVGHVFNNAMSSTVFALFLVRGIACKANSRDLGVK